MEDLLEEYKKKYILSEEYILDSVDEWCLYLYYLENNDLQLNTTYRSPVREFDSHPSFSIYENTRSKRYTTQYLWKDSALNLVGNIFELLSRMYSIGIKEVYELINKDFDILEESKDVSIQKRVLEKPTSKDCRIRIKSKEFSKEGLDFWNQYYVNEELLKWKQVREVEFVWFSDIQEHPYKSKSLSFAYPEYNFKYKEWRYQIYSPKESREYRFRNDLEQNQIYGFNHLKGFDSLVITKSNKDIICLKKFGIEAVSPRSETTKIKSKTIKILQERYKSVVTLFDNDLAGEKAALEYDLPSVFIPKNSGHKDFSDFLKAEGIERSKQLLKQLNII